ncbi:LysR family transcriptional regulator [Aneurinibacillus aneurinilyticus]|jgi:DNA-binding transcriptional LysR family regulator|uniref:LysR family transcriptional regulator n=2 Tax=Aneurinibacillus aneurinilyticus TaxID=1391 RepID=A0A848D5E3_ANEAE|nr:LysR family transcriptional regulator [Aneurinibacillus aneurinilyticus]ERI07391.1 LysR substrate binding domain protein [Aneurinibacillus aneurinilyticus ATCC 12856]MCI1693152.1 LysR family transcriptional regulator [Aneurinibacillus aneurinilyticus]MED0709832.1 LysR family transcriptional regulator [Aneurinibacillus aneurinilyticus]MED0722143.1 LysR family transcriptional regulator [Aneurinibacillus aneurinilyticus]MED0731216.1 LysR family transcriptional regulator [Aneurinibacillus aneur
MELRQLEYFRSVCQELHFTRAAEKIGISQPSLSQQIRLLEHEIGTPLFDRIGKKTALTESGRLLLKYTQNIFHELEQAQAAIKELNGLQRGSISIGTLLTVENYLIPPTLLNFHRLYPAIKISVLGLRTGDIRKNLLENKLDIGIVFLPMEDSELETISLYKEELALAVPNGHSLEGEDAVDLEVLRTTPSILLPETYFVRQLINKSCSNLGFLPQPIFEITTMESLINMVVKGVGVTILPKPYLECLNNNKIRVIPILNSNLVREVGIVYRKDKYMSAAIRIFIDELKATTISFRGSIC